MQISGALFESNYQYEQAFAVNSTAVVNPVSFADLLGLAGIGTNENVFALIGQESKGTVSESGQTDISKIFERLSNGASARQLELTRGQDMKNHISGEKTAPYSYLANSNGMIEYNGAVFQCDNEHQVLSLGDISDDSKVITVSLSGGGTLKVNRDNLDDLSKAISMFSPEDINLIMRAIAQDAKVQQMKQEIDDTRNSIGEAGDSEAAGSVGDSNQTTINTLGTGVVTPDQAETVGFRAYSLNEGHADPNRIWE